MKIWRAIYSRMFVIVGFSLLPIVFPAQPGWASGPALRPELAQVPAGPAGKPVTIQGKIVAFESLRLGVATANGEVWVQLNNPFNVRGVEAAQLSDLTPGIYLATTAEKQADGTLRALAVNIFPEAQRGTAEGHRPHSRLPNATMTNANVEQVVKRVEGPLLTLKYKGGEVKVFVPPDTPIVRIVPGGRELLKPGAGVSIRAVQAPDGSISSLSVTVGLHGFMPPM